MTTRKHRPEIQPKMESIVYLVAEWISLKEMKALQSVCLSPKRRDKEYEEFLSDQDNQVWKEMSEEWQKNHESSRKTCDAVKNECTQLMMLSGRTS